MTDLSDPGAVRELKDLRADVAGRAPGELHRARGLLLAEIEAAGKAGDTSRRARWLRPALLGAVAAAAAAVLTISLLPGSAAHGTRPGAVPASASPPASGRLSSPPPTC